jgi:putative AbiEi antitoxin of type IV toxin-antitoxin system
MARKNSKNSSEKLETKEENLLSTAEIAAEAGVSSQYIARLERAGVIEKAGYGRYARSEVAKIHAFRAGEPLPGEESPAGLTAERILLVRAQREKVELDLAERRGELQSRAENEANAIELVTAFRNEMLAVPDIVAGRFGLRRDVREGIAKAIGDGLEELSKRLRVA